MPGGVSDWPRSKVLCEALTSPCIHSSLHANMKGTRHESMKTIIVNSQKGGSGKTTLCAHLAVQAERAGDGPVFLIDTDPQGTLSTWHEKRQAEEPRRAE